MAIAFRPSCLLAESNKQVALTVALSKEKIYSALYYSMEFRAEKTSEIIVVLTDLGCWF